MFRSAVFKITMSQNTWEKLQDSFLRALELEGAARDAFVQKVQQSDPEMHRELVAMLRHQSGADAYFDMPPLLHESTFLHELIEEKIRKAPVALPLPCQIGNYELVELLGAGGMGEVYLAVQGGPVRRRVALKLIKRHQAMSPSLSRFEAEQQALATLSHHHIAHAYEVGNTADGLPFFTMEYIAGQPITQYCLRHRLTPAARIELFLQVCDGVQHAHEQGVLHRDLKPSNVLVTRSSGRAHAKIIDFGLALCRDGVPGEGPLAGTPRYMSPEQVLTGGSDARGDIFSLGTLLHELLCGQSIYPDRLGRVQSLEELQDIVAHSQALPMKEKLGDSAEAWTFADTCGLPLPKLARYLRKDLESIVAKATARDAECRYQSMACFREDLERFLENRPVSPMEADTGYRISSFLRRHRDSLFRAGMVGLILFTLSFFLIEKQSELGRFQREFDDLGLEYDLILNQLDSVYGHMGRIFDLANPYTLDADAAYAPLLERGEALLADPSLAERAQSAELRKKMARIYLELGQYAQAERHLTFLLDDALANDRQADVIELRYLLSRCHILSKDFERAGARLSELEALEPGWTASGGVDYYDYLILMVTLEQSRGQYQKAFDHGRAVIDHFFGMDIYEEAIGHMALGYLYLIWDAPQNGRQSFENAYSLVDDLLPPESPDLLFIQSSIALSLCEQGSYPEAVALYRDFLPMRERKLGSNHPMILASYLNFGRALYYLGDLEKAERVNTLAIERLSEQFDEDHDHILLGRNNLALLWTELGLFEKAERELTSLVRYYQIEERTDDENYLRVLHNLGDNYLGWRRPELALCPLRDALSLKREVLGREHSSTLFTMGTLAQTLIAIGEFEEARFIIEDTIRLAERHAPYHLGNLNFYKGLEGASLFGLGQRQEGLAKMCESMDALVDHPLFAGLIERFYQAALEQQDPFNLLNQNNL